MGPEDRFWAKVAKRKRAGGCWVWTAALSQKGYGVFWDGVRTVHAHRYSYELHNGPVPDGLQLDHLCRNRACVRPSHLELVTNAVNQSRGERATRTHCEKGHEYTPENTRASRGWRECRECRREYDRQRLARIAARVQHVGSEAH